MDSFIDEVKGMSVADINLILKDQCDLYSEDEIKILQNELKQRPKSNIQEVINTKEELLELERKECEEQNEYEAIFESFTMTTGFDFEGFKIIKYHKVICAETVLGTGFLSEIMANASDFLGSRNSSFSSKLAKARNYSTNDLIKNALALGANAIIGLDFDYVIFGANIIGVIVNGTAVTIKKIEQ